MANDDDGAWFAPKRFGYGAALPIAWQGWTLLAGYLVLVLVIGRALSHHRALQMTIIASATLLVIILSAQHTRGGWRWRSGKQD